MRLLNLGPALLLPAGNQTRESVSGCSQHCHLMKLIAMGKLCVTAAFSHTHDRTAFRTIAPGSLTPCALTHSVCDRHTHTRTHLRKACFLRSRASSASLRCISRSRLQDGTRQAPAPAVSTHQRQTACTHMRAAAACRRMAHSAWASERSRAEVDMQPAIPSGVLLTCSARKPAQPPASQAPAPQQAAGTREAQCTTGHGRHSQLVRQAGGALP